MGAIHWSDQGVRQFPSRIGTNCETPGQDIISVTIDVSLRVKIKVIKFI